MRGSRYMPPVVPAPKIRCPRVPSRSSVIARSASSLAWSMETAARYRTSPAWVSRSLEPPRWNSGRPSSFSSALSCRLTDIGLVLGVEHGDGGAVQDLARLGQPELGTAALEQREAELLLERLELQAHRYRPRPWRGAWRRRRGTGPRPPGSAGAWNRRAGTAGGRAPSRAP